MPRTLNLKMLTKQIFMGASVMSFDLYCACVCIVNFSFITSNNCYLNAVFQCLLNHPAIADLVAIMKRKNVSFQCCHSGKTLFFFFFFFFFFCKCWCMIPNYHYFNCVQSFSAYEPQWFQIFLEHYLDLT